MAKLSKKLVIYLDQNFISEIAKVDKNPRVNPRFKNIRDLINKGFMEEKIVVPTSLFHDIETGFIPSQKENIQEHQGYMGQIRFQHEDSIHTFQLVEAAKKYIKEPSEALNKDQAYHDDPDQRTQQFDTKVDIGIERFFTKADREQDAIALNNIRKSAPNNTFEKQFKLEMNAKKDFFIKNHTDKVLWVLRDQKIIAEFALSTEFEAVPIIEISSKMYAMLLSQYRDRIIKASDPTDVDVISAYFPYVDVFAGDSFMKILVTKDLKLDEKYNTIMFGAKDEDLKAFEEYLENYLAVAGPANVPMCTIFVMPDLKIRENSFEYFKDIGLQLLSLTHSKEYVEIFAFDDGKMPSYEIQKEGLKGYKLPFYGLMDIHPIKINQNITLAQTIDKCKEISKSQNFILIDRYSKISDSFIRGLITAIKNNETNFEGFNIQNKLT